MEKEDHMPGLNCKMRTDIFRDGVIHQTLLKDRTETLAKWICDTREQGIRDALIELGWTPPEEE